MHGRFAILLPENEFVTVSHKIENEEEKKRLKQIVISSLKDKKIGAIVRTAAEGKEKEAIQNDIQNALKKLEYIQKEFEKGKNGEPKIILKSNTIIDKILLDLIDNGLDRIVTNDKELKSYIDSKVKEINEKSNIKINLEEREILDTYELNS